MSSTARRERTRTGTRDALVDAALRLLEQEGASALTMRRLADEVDYTPPVVYQHFSGKRGLVLELIGVGYRRLATTLRATGTDPAPDVDVRVLDAVDAYVAFASAHPHLLELMHDPAVDPDARRTAAQPVVDLIRDLLDDWSRRHGLELDDPEEACEVLWGTLSGIVALGRHDAIGAERARRLSSNAVRALLLGWRTAARI